MAHPSPSPSGSRRHRRLSEVLAEQQEPFSLDLYLLEKSCSPAFIDDAGCGDGACSTCWPTTKSTGRQAVRNRKGSRRSGVLRMLLSKILSSTTAPAVTKTRQRRTATEWRRVAEKRRTPDRFELTLRSSSPRAIEEHMEEDEKQEEDDGDDESSKKQLSPVSVLEQPLFEHSSPPPHEPST